jgi:hypothetical protein
MVLKNIFAMQMDMNMMDFVEFWFIPKYLYSILINNIEFFKFFLIF